MFRRVHYQTSTSMMETKDPSRQMANLTIVANAISNEFTQPRRLCFIVFFRSKCLNKFSGMRNNERQITPSIKICKGNCREVMSVLGGKLHIIYTICERYDT